jgi:hypothetical protein
MNTFYKKYLEVLLAGEHIRALEQELEARVAHAGEHRRNYCNQWLSAMVAYEESLTEEERAIASELLSLRNRKGRYTTWWAKRAAGKSDEEAEEKDEDEDEELQVEKRNEEESGGNSESNAARKKKDKDRLKQLRKRENRKLRMEAEKLAEKQVAGHS